MFRGGLESISSLNSLWNLDYNYLNGLLKKRGRTRAENEAFLQQFGREVARVERTFQEQLAALAESRERVEREGGKAEREVLISMAAKCALLEEFASGNRKATLRVADRFDWLVTGARASALLRDLSLSFMAGALWQETQRWTLERLQRAHGVASGDVGLRRPGDALGWLGFFGGVFLTLLVALIVLLSTQDAVASPMWMPAHRVFRMFLLLALYLLFLSIDVLIWSVVPVDWAFVFGIDQTRYLRSRHYALAAFQVCPRCSFFFLVLFFHPLQIGSITMAMACGCLIHWRMNPAPDSGADYWLLAVFLINLFYLLNPFPFGHRRARMWLLSTLGRIVAAPWMGPLQFRDFWLADQFCSLVMLVTDAGYACCFFAVDLGRQTDHCTATYMPWLRPAMAVLPFWFRFLQCLRRFYDLRVPRDLVNAGKYMLSMLLVLFATLHTALDSSDWGPFHIVWVLCAACAAFGSFLWDILMDFGIGRPHFCLLRRNLLFPKWCYYLAMPLNLVLRCGWLFTVAPSPFVGYVYEKALEFSLAGAEVFRRAHWNLYRLANEQTALMAQLKWVDEGVAADPLPGDTYQRSPRRGRSTALHRVDGSQPELEAEAQALLSSDELPSSADEE